MLVPVKRAISEQIVKKPFNDASTFKNWIKFDGRLGDITYVCTMTDDSIEIERDAEEFGLLEHLEVIGRLEEELDACETAFATTNEQLHSLEGLSVTSGGTVTARATGSKRKRSLTSPNLREKRPRKDSLAIPPGESSCFSGLDPKMTACEKSAETLVAGMETDDAEELWRKSQDMKAQCDALQRQLMENNSFLKASCIRARNSLTSSAIKREFVHAAKE